MHVKLSIKIKTLKITIQFFILFFICGHTYAQELKSFQDRSGILFDVHLGTGIPASDLKTRFGQTQILGGGISYLPASIRLTFGLKFSYLFGSDVKEDVLKPFRTSQLAQVIGSDGYLADVQLKMRGYYGQFYTGSIIPLGSQLKARHGIKWQLGVAYLSHKIRIQDDSRSVTQFNTEFKKGLDRFTSGFSIVPFIGYEYLGVNGKVNLYAGFEPQIGFTQSRRSYNYDTNATEIGITRKDILLSFKIGWYLPFYFGKYVDEIEY